MDLEALRQIGTQALQNNRPREAVAALRAALDLDPRSCETLNSLGNAYMMLREFDNARSAYLAAIAIDDRFQKSLANLGRLCIQIDDYTSAIKYLRSAVDAQPSAYRSRATLANAYVLAQRPDEAEREYVTCLNQAPDHTPALLGLAHLVLARDPARAAALFERITPAERNASVMLGYARALLATGRLADAARLQAELSTRGAHAEAATLQALVDTAAIDDALGRAQAHVNNRRFDEAVDLLQQALARRPDHVAARAALGTTLYAQHRYEPAARIYRQLADELPSTEWTHRTLSVLEGLLGGVERSTAEARVMLDLAPDDPANRVAYLWSRQFREFLSAHDIAERHVALAPPVAATSSNSTTRRVLGRGDKLRIGYLSPDFRRHSVAFFLLPLLRHHDRSRVEVTCYYTHATRDAVTERFIECADRWRDAATLGDDTLERMILDDKIDILIELAGHTTDSRVALLARRLAPIQCSYLGYPNTSGIAESDYRITAAYADPPTIAERLYSERLLHLPRSAWCFAPLEDEPLAQPPSVARGYITFGVTNVPSKMSPAFLMACGEILRRTPGSRLSVTFRPVGCTESEAAILERLASHGIDRARVDLRGWNNRPLAAFNDFDIALDTFPFNGHTMSCLGMWMGVPHITLSGDANISRVGGDLLLQTGLGDLIATSLDQYVDRAVTLANDRARVATIRRELRSRMKAVALGNGEMLARDLEAALFDVWANHRPDSNRDALRLPPPPPGTHVVALADDARVVVDASNVALADELYVGGLEGDDVRRLVSSHANSQTAIVDGGDACGADALALAQRSDARVFVLADDGRSRDRLKASIDRSRARVSIVDRLAEAAGADVIVAFCRDPGEMLGPLDADLPVITLARVDASGQRRLVESGLVGLRVAAAAGALVAGAPPAHLRGAWCRRSQLPTLERLGWLSTPREYLAPSAALDATLLEQRGLFGFDVLVAGLAEARTELVAWAWSLVDREATGGHRLWTTQRALDRILSCRALETPAGASLVARLGVSLAHPDAMAWLGALERHLDGAPELHAGSLVLPDETPVWGVRLSRRILASALRAIELYGDPDSNAGRLRRLERFGSLGVPSERMSRALEVAYYRDNLERRRAIRR